MDRSTSAGKKAANHPLGTDAEGILQELSTRQHLGPHRPLKDVVADTVESTGLCPDAAARALAWLNLSPDRSIGRLRRGELMQLARCMYRYWLESANATAATCEPR
jgi:hypothetical protein